MATDSIPQQLQEQPKQIESADLIVAILAEMDSDAIAGMCGSLQRLPGSLRIAIVQDERHTSPGIVHAAPGDNAASISFVPSLLARPGGTSAGPPSMASIYQSIFAAGEKLQSRACCIIASKLEAPSRDWVGQLARPLLDGNADLVTPRYVRRKFEGLLNVAVIAPLMRTLYGKRLHNPMGPDFGVSQRLFQKMQETSTRTGTNGFHPLASLAPAALCENLPVAEMHCGTRVYPPPDWANTSSLLAEALGPVFTDLERHASCWQRMRISAPAPAIGDAAMVSHDTTTLDTSRMLESFQLATRELQEIWGLVLPPYTLFELRKLSRLPPEQFRMPDELWVRIVYDFALAHRLRTINRDHLLKSMTPLYLGWVASYARDLQSDSGITPDQRIERLAAAFESGKPYLVSRWRWPDRFNP